MAINVNAFFNKISKLRMIHRIFIFGGSVVLVLGLYIWLVFIPKASEITAVKSELDRLEREIRLVRIRAKNMKKLEAALAKSQEDLRIAIRLLPTTSEIPSLLKSITKAGNDSNLEFLLFSPERQVSKEFYVEIPISMEVLGRYHNVAMFFDKVGKLDRIVNVSNVNMAPIKELSTTLKTSCKATTFMFKEVKKAESVPKKKK